MRHGLGVILVGWMLAGTAEAGFPPWVQLDPKAGALDGRTAMAFLPVDLTADPSDPFSYFLDPAGCTAHYVLKDDLDTEEVYPCGTWVQPSSGKFFSWIEKDWQRTPFVTHGFHSAAPSRGSGMIDALPLAPAGRVALAEALPGHSLHVLHLDSHLQGEFPQREVFRRIAEPDLRQGALLPEGKVVAALFDRTAGAYVWMSQPAAVEARQTTVIAPPRPSKSTDLFVSLHRSEPVARHDKLAVDLRAGEPGKGRPPDVIVPGVYHVHAVWYDLEGAYARLEASTETSYLEAVDVPLRPGKVESFTGELQPKPSLEAVLDLPPELPPAPRTLEVLWPESYELVRRIELSPGTDRHVLPVLPAGELLVSLQSPPWTLTETVDLSDGIDRTVTFSPRPILLSGTVYAGKKPHPATVVFSTNRAQDELRVDTDGEGRYETFLFRPGIYLIRIELAGRESPGFVELTREPIRESRELDFWVPGNRFEVVVTDQHSGEAIAGAEVNCHLKADQGTTVGLYSETKDDGVAVLPPLRTGQLKLVVSAEGYLPEEVAAGRVEEQDQERRLEVALEPEGERRHLLLTLADGRPAAFAEVREQFLGEVPWKSAADAAGRLAVPDAVRGSTLLVRHPEAAFRVQAWQPGSEETIYWQLPPAQPPLEVRVLASWGEPVEFAEMALRAGGHWWTGVDLAWLTRSTTATSRNGRWTAAQLPQAPLEIAAWSREAASPDQAPLDAGVVTVPWPRGGEPVEIQALP